MRLTTLEILRCPYCGGRFDLVESIFHVGDDAAVRDGMLGCHCSIFAVVDGIPVLHLDGASAEARAHVEAGRPDLARHAMFGLSGDAAARFDALAAAETSTYLAIVDAIDPTPEGKYFLYRFSDPTYVVAQALVRAVAGAVLRTGGRAIDVCGGSGHLTRLLVDLTPEPPVLADLYFSKLWLARRFTAPGVEAVCCDANAPLPFARGAFRFAACVDAFMFIWTKRLLVGEMLRLLDDPNGGTPAAALLGHVHNADVWSPSHGNPLPPQGYLDLFETLEARMYGEATLFADVVNGGPLDLSRHDSADVMAQDPALAVVACTRVARNAVFKPHPLDRSPGVRGELRVNPLYQVETQGDQIRLLLRFPSDDYADEFGACRAYLPDDATVGAAALAELASGRVDASLADLVRRLVILDLPKRYY
jgi:uncharacterized protein YbaR (Trm112 family)